MIGGGGRRYAAKRDERRQVGDEQAIIDLLIPGQSPGIKERLVDLYGKPEILFFGPDGECYVRVVAPLALMPSRQRGPRI